MHEDQPQRKSNYTIILYVIEGCCKDDGKNETSRHQFKGDFNSNLENVKSCFNNRFEDNYIKNLQEFAYYKNFKNSERVMVDHETLTKEGNSPKMCYRKGATFAFIKGIYGHT